MKFLVALAILSCFAIGQTMAGGAQIVAAVRSQIGLPYSWGGGSWAGKSKGIESGAHTIGFDCSGLAQYGVYQGTHKKIARVAHLQYQDKQCKHYPFAEAKPGDLVFFQKGSDIHHVAIVTGPNTIIQAPHTGDHVREGPYSTQGAHERMAQVARCW